MRADSCSVVSSRGAWEFPRKFLVCAQASRLDTRATDNGRAAVFLELGPYLPVHPCPSLLAVYQVEPRLPRILAYALSPLGP